MADFELRQYAGSLSIAKMRHDSRDGFHNRTGRSDAAKERNKNGTKSQGPEEPAKFQSKRAGASSTFSRLHKVYPPPRSCMGTDIQLAPPNRKSHSDRPAQL